MGGASTTRERQADRRARLRGAGLKYIHVWVQPDQEHAIKAYLSGLTGPEVDGQHAHKAKEDAQALANEQFERWGRLADEASERLKEIQVREDRLQAEERRLKILGAKTEKGLGEARVSDKARTEALIQQFTTRTQWRTGERQVIDDPHTISERAEQASKLTRQTKSAATVLGGIIEEFKTLLGEREIDELAAAVKLVRRIGAAAETAKDRARAMEKRIHEEDRMRTSLASKATNAILETTSLPNQILAMCILNLSDHSWYLRDLLKLEDVRYNLNRSKEELHQKMVGRLKGLMKDGNAIEQSVAILKAEIAEATPQAREKYGPSIERVLAELVSIELNKAASKIGG